VEKSNLQAKTKVRLLDIGAKMLIEWAKMLIENLSFNHVNLQSLL